MISCKDQAEIDYFWEKLGDGGDPSKQACGWLNDKYGLSWQILPEGMRDMMTGEDEAGSDKTFSAMLNMTKLDVAGLKEA